MGYTNSKKCETELAQVYYKKAIKYYPKLPLVHINIGIEFQRTNNKKNAFNSLKDSL